MDLPVKIRAFPSGNVADVKLLILHPMENGLRKGRDGALIPANFIRRLTVSIGGKTYLDADLGAGISKDPYLSFRARGVRTGGTPADRARSVSQCRGSESSYETIRCPPGGIICPINCPAGSVNAWRLHARS